MRFAIQRECDAIDTLKAADSAVNVAVSRQRVRVLPQKAKCR
jgi:hypothetical protein